MFLGEESSYRTGFCCLFIHSRTVSHHEGHLSEEEQLEVAEESGEVVLLDVALFDDVVLQKQHRQLKNKQHRAKVIKRLQDHLKEIFMRHSTQKKNDKNRQNFRDFLMSLRLR